MLCDGAPQQTRSMVIRFVVYFVGIIEYSAEI